MRAGRLGLWAFYGLLAAAVAALGGYLAVSLLVQQAPEVEVPDVTGKGLSEALDRLRATGLDLEVRSFRYSQEVPENRIVRQVPEGGRVVKAGRGVGVVLSRGPERHPTPDVRGLSLEDARILLEEASLRGRVAARLHRGPSDQVVAQAVEPGRRLPPEAEVPLAVSAGPDPALLRMPRLEGLALEEAMSELDRLDLRVARVEEVSLEDPEREGRLVSQEPLPGFPVVRGEGVTVAVAGSAGTGGLSRWVWVSHPLPAGYARHRVEVVVEAPGTSRVLADQWMGGGQVFRRWIPVLPGQAVRLRVDGDEVRTVEE